MTAVTARCGLARRSELRKSDGELGLRSWFLKAWFRNANIRLGKKAVRSVKCPARLYPILSEY